MPRMKADNVELLPRDVSSVVLGVMLPISVMSSAPRISSDSPEKALTAIGTSSKFSSRRRAVTMITSPPSDSSEAVVAVCAAAGAVHATPDKAMPANKAARITEILGDFISHSPPQMRVFTR